MVRGFFGLFIKGIEEKNPEFLFEDIKNEKDKSRKEAEKQIIAIQTSAELIKMEMKTSEKNLNAVTSRIEMAKRQGDKDILVELLVQEEEYMSTFETHKATYDNAISEVTRIKEDYKIFE